MVLFDSNILINAALEDQEHHEEAKQNNCASWRSLASFLFA